MCFPYTQYAPVCLPYFEHMGRWLQLLTKMTITEIILFIKSTSDDYNAIIIIIIIIIIYF